MIDKNFISIITLTPYASNSCGYLDAATKKHPFCRRPFHAPAAPHTVKIQGTVGAHCQNIRHCGRTLLKYRETLFFIARVAFTVHYRSARGPYIAPQQQHQMRHTLHGDSAHRGAPSARSRIKVCLSCDFGSFAFDPSHKRTLKR